MYQWVSQVDFKYNSQSVWYYPVYSYKSETKVTEGRRYHS